MWTQGSTTMHHRCRLNECSMVQTCRIMNDECACSKHRCMLRPTWMLKWIAWESRPINVHRISWKKEANYRDRKQLCTIQIQFEKEKHFLGKKIENKILVFPCCSTRKDLSICAIGYCGTNIVEARVKGKQFSTSQN